MILQEIHQRLLDLLCTIHMLLGGSNEAAMEVGKGTGTSQHILATEKGEEIRRRKRVGDVGIYR
jgi:hypothetical protein